MNRSASAPTISIVTDSSSLNGPDRICVACEERLPRSAFLLAGKCGLFRCDSCGTWTLLPRPTSQAQASLHDTTEYFDHPYFRARRQDQTLSLRRCRTIFEHIGRMTDVNQLRGGRMLDIGCDVGSLLVAAAENYGVTPVGLDVAFRALEAARSRGVEIFRGIVEEAPEAFSRFKLVTAVDIIEHTTDPGAFLRSVHERMSSGGILYIQTPNCESAIYRIGWRISGLTNGRPQGAMERLFPPQHIQYFNRRGFRLLAERCGFQVLDLQTRVLPANDIVTSSLVRAGLMGLQVIDSWRKEQILLCAVLKKP
jgi:SAM-dependent methyltransferase